MSRQHQPSSYSEDVPEWVHARNIAGSQMLLDALMIGHPELCPKPAPVIEVEPEPIEIRPISPFPPAPNEETASPPVRLLPFSGIRMIQLAVCKEFGITLTDMKSQRRTKDVIVPRHVAMYLSKRLTGMSLPGIGRMFGGRDHTTALSAIRRIELLMQSKPTLAQRVLQLEEQLGGAIA